MTTTVQSIIDQASILLKDVDHDRWSEADLLYYFNEGQRQKVIEDPASNMVNIPVLLRAGVDQVTPDDCNELVDVTLNLGREWVSDTKYYQGQRVFDSGLRYRCLEAHTSSPLFATDSAKWETADYISGLKINEISEANMDQHFDAAWTVQGDYEDKDFEPTIAAWVRKQGPDTYQSFFISPGQPQVGRMFVAMSYSQIPADVPLDGNITLRDKFSACLLDYILFRAYSLDMDNEMNQAVALNYFNKFRGEAMSPLKRRR